MGTGRAGDETPPNEPPSEAGHQRGVGPGPPGAGGLEGARDTTNNSIIRTEKPSRAGGRPHDFTERLDELGGYIQEMAASGPLDGAVRAELMQLAWDIANLL